MTSTPPAAEPNDRVVLLVEDEVVLRSSMMRGLLKLPRIEVLDAGTVAEALRVTERVRPGVMICDIDLPDGSGIELLAQLERQGKRVPTVFVSAYLPRFRQQIAQRPGVMMLEKPVALSKLREIVVQHLGPDAAATKPSPFLLTDYVQLATMGNRSVLLEVLRDGQRVGEVLVRAGQAWHAHDGKGAGVDALMRLMHAHDVTVTCTTPPDDLAPPRTLSGSGEHALLEAARRFDEGREQISAAFDELFDDTPTEAPPPVSTVPPHAASTTPPPPAPQHETFDDAYERGVEALLERDYARAYGLLVAASQLGTSASLEANLTRLRALGFGT